jgi:hypothetical protein
MEGDSLTYDCALAAGLLICEGFVPGSGKPDDDALGQIVLIIMEAMGELGRRQGSMVPPPPHLHLNDGGKVRAHRAEGFRFFCPKCFRHCKGKAALMDRRCRCRTCGSALLPPDMTGRN